MYLWWNLCDFLFTRIPGKSYRMWFRSRLLCLMLFEWRLLRATIPFADFNHRQNKSCPQLQPGGIYNHLLWGWTECAVLILENNESVTLNKFFGKKSTRGMPEAASSVHRTHHTFGCCLLTLIAQQCYMWEATASAHFLHRIVPVLQVLKAGVVGDVVHQHNALPWHTFSYSTL